MMRVLGLLALTCFAACSSQPVSWKPQAVRQERPLLQRGWSFVESEKEILGLEAGSTQVSYSAPLVVGEKLVFGSERFGLTVLGKRSGQLLWQKRFPEPVAAQPLAQEERLFVGTESGSLHQFDLESGNQKWEVNLSAPVTGSMLFAFDRLLVATADEALHAVDPATGKVMWVYRRPAFAGTGIRGGGHPAAINGKIWMGFSDGALVSIDPQTGGMDSERIFRDNLKFTDVDARVIGYKDGLLVTTYDGKLRHLRKDGSLAWEFAAGGARTPLLVEGGTVYLPSSDGTVYAINADTGKESWRHVFHRGVPTGLALGQGGEKTVLVVTGSEEKVLALNPVNGELLGQSSLGRGSGSYSPVAVDDGGRTFYVLSSFSRIYQYRLN